MVESPTSVFEYTLSTVVQALPYSNLFLANDQLRVVRVETDQDDVETEILLTLNSDYSVTGALNPIGGTVTTIAEGDHDLQIGDVIRLSRAVPITQLTDYISNNSFSTGVVERDFDKLCMIAQMLANTIGELTITVNTLRTDIDGLEGTVTTLTGNVTTLQTTVTTQGETIVELQEALEGFAEVPIEYCDDNDDEVTGTFLVKDIS